MPKKLTQEEVKKRLKLNNIIPISKYKNRRTKIKVRCLKCNYIWEALPHHLFTKNRCPQCAKKNRKEKKLLKKEEIIKKLKEKNSEILGDYKGLNKKTLIRCLKCGYTRNVTPYSIIRGSGCIKCSRKKINESRKLTLKEVEKRFIENGYKLLSNYVNNGTKVKTKCLKCKFVWEVRPGDIFSGKAGCPKCALKFPKWEEEIINLLKKYGIENIIYHYKFNGKKEIDIFLPDYKLGIELNGLYWHSWGPNIKNSFRNNKSLAKWHLYEKKMLALKKDIDIIFIFEHEYYDELIFNKILNFVLAKIGLSQKHIIYARSCNFVEIDNQTAFNFYEKYHILGKPTYCKHFGLIYNDKLISLMSFRREKNEWIITRYCIHPEYKIIGGFQKLIKNSIKYLKINLEIEPIVTFIDLRFVNPYNNVFTRNGFVKISEVEPRYFYWKQINNRTYKILERRNAQKPRLQKILQNFNPDLTEEENVFQEFDGMQFDCGKIKLKLIL